MTVDPLLAADTKGGGHVRTLQEILQQPATWLDTCDRMVAAQRPLMERLAGIASLVLSGSGSSQFAGECVRPVLQRELGIGVETVGGGALLTHGAAAISPARPSLVVSLARSGNSPESVSAMSFLLDTEPRVRHLVITCNGDGELAMAHRDRVDSVILDPRTNDRSLVMTSSFTNLVLAARFLGMLDQPERYRSLCSAMCDSCVGLLARHFDTLERVGRMRFERVVYLAGGPDRGAVRECSLKMLEITAGRVATLPETYLGLRHGPMSFIDDRSLVVCFLSSNRHLREYESDLIRELNRKKLGAMKLIAGEGIDASLLVSGDVPVEVAADDDAPVIQVVIGQLLAFFRCLQEGLKPDSPSENVLARAHRAGLTTSIDPGFDPSARWERDILDTLEEVDVFFPNEIELEAVGGSADPETVLRALDNGRTCTIAKLGAQGCVLLVEGRPVHVPAFAIEPVDTTGAGDSFNAGFLHAWLNGRGVIESVQFGAACGALSTQGLGGIAAQPTESQAAAFLAVRLPGKVHR